MLTVFQIRVLGSVWPDSALQCRPLFDHPTAYASSTSTASTRDGIRRRARWQNFNCTISQVSMTTYQSLRNVIDERSPPDQKAGPGPCIVEPRYDETLGSDFLFVISGFCLCIGVQRCMGIDRSELLSFVISQSWRNSFNRGSLYRASTVGGAVAVSITIRTVSVNRTPRWPVTASGYSAPNGS